MNVLIFLNLMIFIHLYSASDFSNISSGLNSVMPESVLQFINNDEETRAAYSSLSNKKEELVSYVNSQLRGSLGSSSRSPEEVAEDVKIYLGTKKVTEEELEQQLGVLSKKMRENSSFQRLLRNMNNLYATAEWDGSQESLTVGESIDFLNKDQVGGAVKRAVIRELHEGVSGSDKAKLGVEQSELFNKFKQSNQDSSWLNKDRVKQNILDVRDLIAAKKAASNKIVVDEVSSFVVDEKSLSEPSESASGGAIAPETRSIEIQTDAPKKSGGIKASLKKVANFFKRRSNKISPETKALSGENDFIDIFPGDSASNRADSDEIISVESSSSASSTLNPLASSKNKPLSLTNSARSSNIVNPLNALSTGAEQSFVYKPKVSNKKRNI